MSDESPDLPEPGPAQVPAEEDQGGDDLPRADPALHEPDPELARADADEPEADRPAPNAADASGEITQAELFPGALSAAKADKPSEPSEPAPEPVKAQDADAQGSESGEADEQPDEPEPEEAEEPEGVPAPEALSPERGDGRPAFVAPVSLALSIVTEDDAYQLREPGDVAGLATSIARLGQLFPVDVRPKGDKVQVLAGFRRLKALRMLQRDRVMARVHEGMTDADALAFTLAQALEARALEREEIEALRDRLAEEGRLDPVSRGLIDAAITAPGSDLEPESGSEPAEEEGEVDLDELAADLEQRLSGISADLAAVTDLWGDLEEGARAALLDQLRYYSELYAYFSKLK